MKNLNENNINLDDIRLSFKQNSVSHRLLHVLSKEDADTASLKKLAGASVQLIRVKELLLELSGLKLIQNLSDGKWAITTKGLHVSVILGAPSEGSVVRRKSGSAEIFRRPDYVPTELGFTCQRQGAYDAFLLPSRIGNELHYPSGRVEKA